MTKAIADTPNEPEYIEIGFEKGIPIGLKGQAMGGGELISKLNHPLPAFLVGHDTELVNSKRQ